MIGFRAILVVLWLLTLTSKSVLFLGASDVQDLIIPVYTPAYKLSWTGLQKTLRSCHFVSNKSDLFYCRINQLNI